MNKQLYRSRVNKKIAGVCGGIAEYFNIDPTIVRLVWVLFTITYGIGFLAYIVAVIIIPEGRNESFDYNQGQNQKQDQNQTGNSQDWHENEHRERAGFDSFRGRIVLGGALVVIGILLLGSLYMPWLDMRHFWPIIVIAFGVLLLISGGGNRK